MFGKDIKPNICTFITFADDAVPAVRTSLQSSCLAFSEVFTFNNSALFAENQKSAGNPLSPMFWEMGCSSFERFFLKFVRKMEKKSISLTKSVFNERIYLKSVVSNLLLQVTEELLKIPDIKKKQEEVYNTQTNVMRDNENYKFTYEETKQICVDVQPGVHVNNCRLCNITCHHPCQISSDDEKNKCTAINQITGKCIVCPKQCHWRFHYIGSYFLEETTVTVTKYNDLMKGRYKEAKTTIEKFNQYLKTTEDSIFKNINSMLERLSRCITRLQKIAFPDDPLTLDEHIDLMIEAEKRKLHNPMHLERIKTLQNLKKMKMCA